MPDLNTKIYPRILIFWTICFLSLGSGLSASHPVADNLSSFAARFRETRETHRCPGPADSHIPAPAPKTRFVLSGLRVRQGSPASAFAGNAFDTLVPSSDFPNTLKSAAFDFRLPRVCFRCFSCGLLQPRAPPA